jgi:hypothetical protein
MANRIQHITITEITLLMLFEEMITAYIRRHAKHMNIKHKVTDCYIS